MSKAKHYFLVFLLSLFFVSASFIPVAWASEYYGDSILHLGSTGYAQLANSSVTGLDLTKDFSVEAVVNIESYTAGGRWATIVGKSATGAYDKGAGFSLQFNQGHFFTFGQEFSVKVADGTNSAAISPSTYYQGITYAIMTWNATSKNLNLYINGNKRRQQQQCSNSSCFNSKHKQFGYWSKNQL